MVGGGGDDRKVLREHEAALQRLEELQRGMVGGEKAGDSSLQEDLDQRRRKAEIRLETIRKTNYVFGDDDEDNGIMERIFNSLTEEVRVKSRVLERSQAKLRAATEEIKDLSAEFELDRQDYLDMIRTQQRQLQLQEQLLQTVVPCLRRDCNYYNIDRIRDECVWDEDIGSWILPKLTTKKTTLSPVSSKTALLEKRSTTSSKLAKQIGGTGLGMKTDLQVSKGPRPSSYNPAHTHNGIPTGAAPTFHLGSADERGEEEDKYRLQLQQSREPDYFKPKRAAELLAMGSQLRDSLSTEQKDVGVRRGSLPATVSSAAVVHGVDGLIASDAGYSKRPGKLQALSVSPSLPRNLGGLPPPDSSVHLLEKAEKRISSRKWNSLEPLQDLSRQRRPRDPL